MKPGTQQAFATARAAAKIRIGHLADYATNIESAHMNGDLAEVLKLTECIGVTLAELRLFTLEQQGLGEPCVLCNNTMTPVEEGLVRGLRVSRAYVQCEVCDVKYPREMDGEAA